MNDEILKILDENLGVEEGIITNRFATVSKLKELLEKSFSGGKAYYREYQISEDSYSSFSGFQLPNKGVDFEEWYKQLSSK